MVSCCCNSRVCFTRARRRLGRTGRPVYRDGRHPPRPSCVARGVDRCRRSQATYPRRHGQSGGDRIVLLQRSGDHHAHVAWAQRIREAFTPCNPSSMWKVKKETPTSKFSRSPGRSALCLVFVAVAIAGCATSPTTPESYLLTVRLQDPYNRDVTITTPVAVDQPFAITNRNDQVQNVITGILKPPVDSRFPMELTVSKWKSEISNMRDKEQLSLVLDKPWSSSLVSSVMYLRTVTLTKMGTFRPKGTENP